MIYTTDWKRCECCLGMGYKGQTVRGSWKVLTCRQCRGMGMRPASERQRQHKPRN